jgi:hypothetical protein
MPRRFAHQPTLTMIDRKTLDRFESKYDRPLDGCWEWLTGKGRRDYPRFWVAPMMACVGAHRVAYLISRGSLDPDLYVLHHCDNMRCVRPEHIYEGTPQDNLRDMYARGRQKPIQRKIGEDHHLSKLKAVDVLSIRAEASVTGESLCEFANRKAKEHQIHSDTVRIIIRGLTWKHLL